MTAAGEKSILFQAAVPHGAKITDAWFVIGRSYPNVLLVKDIPPLTDIGGKDEGDLMGINSALFGSSLYTVGGLSNCIRCLDTRNRSTGWEKICTLPTPCADSVLGFYGTYLYILPGASKYDRDETRLGYLWSTGNKTSNVVDPPADEGGKRQWGRIRACAALHGRGLLIAMDGMDGEQNFYLHNPNINDWEICEFKDPLPKFKGETSFAVSNGRLYILEVPVTSPASLHIYDINEGKLLVNKHPLGCLDLSSLPKEDRVVRLVPMADDKLCFLWLGGKDTRRPHIRILHYLQVKISVNSNPGVGVVNIKEFVTDMIYLFDCIPYDQEEGIAPVHHSLPPIAPFY